MKFSILFLDEVGHLFIEGVNYLIYVLKLNYHFF